MRPARQKGRALAQPCIRRNLWISLSQRVIACTSHNPRTAAARASTFHAIVEMTV
jgi:hypothetical protein